MNFNPNATMRQLMLSLWITATSLGFLAAGPAVAQPSAGRGVEIVAFEVEPMQQLAPGSTLVFRVKGTPRGRATVRVSGLAPTVQLHETAGGLYEGSVILRRSDRVDPRAGATATLRLGGRSASASLPRLIDAPAVASQRPSSRIAAPAPTTYVVSRFTVPPVDQVGPGAVLRFILEGTPGGAASVSIEGIASRIALAETRPGYYEGSYTVQPQDQVIIGFRAVASLQEPPERAAAARLLGIPPGAGAPAVHSVVPKEGASVAAGGAISVAGRFGDPGGAGVDPKSIRLNVGGRDVTRDASVTSSTFNYRAELRPGTYAVEVTARDAAGRPVRYGWQFTVGSGAPASRSSAVSATSGEMPLEITSHLANATVQPGRIVVSGRTAPSTGVAVQVKAFAPAASGAPEVLYNNRLRSDANGDFGFAFQPNTPVHGTRYDIELEAGERGQGKSARLSLFQQR